MNHRTESCGIFCNAGTAFHGLPHMKFDHHAFISYAHIDNEPLTPGQKGWVAQFHATLQRMLSQRLGEKARIWRDDKLEGNDMFAQEITEALKQVAAERVSALSPLARLLDAVKAGDAAPPAENRN